MSDENDITGLFKGAFWSSAFRPFYLLGVLYGLWVMGMWALVTLGYMSPLLPDMSLALWHGHEMIFGFSGAIVLGFTLTALPGWAGTEEIRRGQLALLVLLWLLGRAGFYGEIIPDMLRLILESSLYLVAALMVLPGLLKIPDKHYLMVLVIFLMMAGGNILFYLGIFDGDMAAALYGIKVGVMAIVVKFMLAGGFLATTFTSNALKQKGLPGVEINPVLEYISAFSLLLFSCAVLMDLPGTLAASLAVITAVVQLVRFLRWRSFQIRDASLVLIMHLAYLWFILAVVIFAVESWLGAGVSHIWLHVFTVGALSLMMLSLITRVALRHTGRSLRPASAMVFGFAMMGVATIFRLMVSLDFLDQDWLVLAAMIWALSFLIYIVIHGLYLIRPSLPKKARSGKRASEVGQ